MDPIGGFLSTLAGDLQRHGRILQKRFPGEQEILLGHVTDFCRPAGDILAVQKYPALIGLSRPAAISAGCSARTAGAEQGDEFSHVYPERDLFQNRQYLCSEGVG